MSPADRFAEAFAYAWWLTGDDEHAATAAERAVAAAADPPAGGAGDVDTSADGDAASPTGGDLPLLAAVRSIAVDRPTMCPASEVALLHDGHLIDLTDAASLVEIDAEDARTELAHGRLEALLETPRAPIQHPERLGGLAVGSPADIAHARQCDSCAAVRDLLIRGREELRSLPRPVPPPGRELTTPPGPAAPMPVVAPVPEAAVPATPPSTERPEPVDPPLPAAAPSEDSTAGAGAVPLAEEDAPAGETEPGAEPDTETEAEPDPEPEPPAKGRRTGVIVSIIVLVVLAFFAAIVIAATLTTSGAELSSDIGQEEVDADAPAPADVAPPAETSATEAAEAAEAAETEPPLEGDDPDTPPRETEAPASGTDAPEAVEGLRITEAAVVGADGDRLPSGARLDGQEPVRVLVTYAGAEAPLELRASWTVDGQDFRTLAIELPAGDRTHTIGAPAPAEGWPTGIHQLVLSADGGVLAAVDFRVV